MFIREYKTKNKKTGKIYIKHQLVESYRTEAGPRQRIVMNLGKVNLNKSGWRKLAFVLEGKLSGQDSLLDEPGINAAADAAMKNYDFYKIRKKNKVPGGGTLTIDPEKVGATACRSLGPELAGASAWDRLSMDAILKEAGLDKKSRELTKATVLARLISPASEARTLKWIRKRSYVAEIINTDLLEVKKDPIYEIADILLYHKEAIEKLLREKEEAIFPDSSTLFLYDLTNTYFEGQCKNNSIAKRGKSKEKRSDCPLICLALLVDSRGYPVFSQIYEGNKSEPVTLESVLDRLETDVKKTLFSKKPTIVADRGIATKDNIALLAKRGYPYMVIERKRSEASYIKEFEKAKNSFDKIVKGDGTIYFKKIKAGGVARLLVLSQAKKEKEEAMDSLKESRFLEDAGKLKKSVSRGSVMLLSKIQIRIGRLIQKYPTVVKYYDMSTETDTSGKKVLTLKVNKKKEKRDDRKVLTGCYVIETTHIDMDAADILKSYHSLTRIEAAFKSLKTDLGLRPVYHQTGQRSMGHLFISVLAYHLLNTIELALASKGERTKWSTIRDELSTHMRTTVILTGTDGSIYHTRVSSRPETRHREIYELLGIKDPLKRIHLKL
ncbi:MAG: IS1634 family transposase [Dehalococcoidia bacterium]|nr:MAG: IS1634 family transposase [Dehalococcoidia bacterium]